MIRSLIGSLASTKSRTSNRRRRTARRPQAESLEGRLLLTAGTWTTFGAGTGFVLTKSLTASGKKNSSSQDSAQAVAIQGDGKILAAGWSSVAGTYPMEVVRLNPDGSLDDGSSADTTSRSCSRFPTTRPKPVDIGLLHSPPNGNLDTSLVDRQGLHADSGLQLR